MSRNVGKCNVVGKRRSMQCRKPVSCCNTAGAIILCTRPPGWSFLSECLPSDWRRRSAFDDFIHKALCNVHQLLFARWQWMLPDLNLWTTQSFCDEPGKIQYCQKHHHKIYMPKEWMNPRTSWNNTLNPQMVFQFRRWTTHVSLRVDNHHFKSNPQIYYKTEPQINIDMCPLGWWSHILLPQ